MVKHYVQIKAGRFKYLWNWMQQWRNRWTRISFPAFLCSNQHIVLTRDSSALSTYFDGCLEQFSGAMHPTVIIENQRENLREMEMMLTNFLKIILLLRLLGILPTHIELLILQFLGI